MRPAFRFAISILSLALLGAPAFAAPPERAKGRCPYGHEDLVSVPVLYGYPDFNQELSGALDRGEIALGGCEVGEGSPSEVTRCRRCGFRLRKTAEGNLWWRDSEDLSSFEIPLPAFFEEVARVFDKGIRKARKADPEDAPRFEQSLRGGVAVKEYAGIIVGDSGRRVVPEVQRILARYPIRVAPKKLAPADPSSFRADLADQHHEGWVTITHSWEDRTVVAIVWDRKARSR
jgi:hypothetical protein